MLIFQSLPLYLFLVVSFVCSFIYYCWWYMLELYEEKKNTRNKKQKRKKKTDEYFFLFISDSNLITDCRGKSGHLRKIFQLKTTRRI